MKMPKIIGIRGLQWDWDATGPNANLVGLQAEEGGQKNIAGFCRPLIWHVTRMMELYKY